MSGPTVPPGLAQAIKLKKCVPLVGAGLSRQADPSRFTNWQKLLTKLADHGLTNRCYEKATADQFVKEINNGRFLSVADDLRRAISPETFADFFEHHFDPKDLNPSAAHTLLIDLSPPLILTTNFDRLIEDAYAEKHHKSMSVHCYDNPEAVQRKLALGARRVHPFLFKLHGDIEDPRSLILTGTDYTRLRYDATGFREVLTAIFVNHVVLMLGYSFRDPELREYLGFLRHRLRRGSTANYILLAEGEKAAEDVRDLRNDFGLQQISYSSRNNSIDVVNFLRKLVKLVPPGRS